MEPIAVILFDADGVIQQPTSNRRELWTQLLGGNADAVDGFVRDVFAVERPCYHGEGDFVGAFREVMARWNCTGTLQDALQAWTAIEVDREVVTLIEAVRATGLPCCLATNQEPFRGRYMSETLGYQVVFDRQFYSCELGFSKPDPQYFTAILEQLNVPAVNVLFIDDIEANVKAAQSVGIEAALFAPEAGTAAVEWMRPLLKAHGVPDGAIAIS